MRPAHLAAAALMALAAACSSAEEVNAPPVTLDEQRALAEAQAMILASELPTTTPAPTLAATEPPPDGQ